MRQRTAYFDFVRGIAILMVVAIHTFPMCSFNTIPGVCQVLIRQIVGCPVPLFLAISGYFLGKKKFESKQERMTFWKRQVPKVYIPALIWSLFYYVLAVKDGSNPFLSFCILVCMGYSIYYFIALIIQCYLLLPLLQKVDSKRWGGVILGVSLLSGAIIAWFGGNKLPLTVYAGPFTTWIVFFYMGVFLSKADRTYSLYQYVIFLLLSVLLMMVEAYILCMNSLGGIGLKPTVYIYSILVILILFSEKVQTLYNENNVINRIITYIGKISFGIYLIHFIVLNILNHFIIVDVWMLKWSLTTTISVMLIMVSRFILSDTINKYIGFK